jgi:hypothetical protein
LAGFFTGGVANLLKGDTAVVSSMATPYEKLVGTLSYSSSQTDTEPLEQGFFHVKTPVGAVAVSIDKVASLQSALRIPEIAGALDTSWQTLGTQIQTKISNDPFVCFEVGKTLELNQNLSHADAVDALAKIVNYSSINSNQATNCLGTYFGPEVARDLKTLNPDLHLGPGYPNIQNLVLFPQVQLDFAKLVKTVNEYTAGTGSQAVLNTWFETPVSITDTAPGIFPQTTSLSIEEILNRMKGASAHYVYYGCQEKDASVIDNVPATGFFLAIGADKKPDDVLIMRTWWRYEGENQPRIYQMYLGYDAAINQALSDYKNVCAYHVTVKSAGAAAPPPSLGSSIAQPTPAGAPAPTVE